jgi:hypothetical protein
LGTCCAWIGWGFEGACTAKEGEVSPKRADSPSSEKNPEDDVLHDGRERVLTSEQARERKGGDDARVIAGGSVTATFIVRLVECTKRDGMRWPRFL